MENFESWCAHYEYDTKAPEAKEDYKKYSDNLTLFRSMGAKTEAKGMSKELQTTFWRIKDLEEKYADAKHFELEGATEEQMKRSDEYMAKRIVVEAVLYDTIVRDFLLD